MNVFVTLEHRFHRTPDGAVWTGGNLGFEFWKRYLNAFDAVTIVGRVQDVDGVPDGWRSVEGPNVSMLPLAGYHGPKEFARNLPSLRSTLRRLDAEGNAVIFRLPGMVSTLFNRYSIEGGHPFGVEVVGDPWDVFSPGANHHPLRPLLRRAGARSLRSMCAQAAAVSYVSSYRLPNRYPARPGAFTTSYSSIELDPAHFDTKPRTYADDPSQEWSILVAGSLEQPYKGVDILLTALSAVLQHGFRARLTVLGDGKYRPALEQQAENLRISEKVRFLGQIPAGDQVRAQLNCADLFVLPSRTEGLPRAIIEAMARGLPCLGTNVGGIPELIDDDAMVPPDNPDALAEKIIEVLSSPWRMGRMSADNLARAHAYEKDVLQARRDEFYLAVREATYVTTIKT